MLGKINKKEEQIVKSELQAKVSADPSWQPVLPQNLVCSRMPAAQVDDRPLLTGLCIAQGPYLHASDDGAVRPVRWQDVDAVLDLV